MAEPYMTDPQNFQREADALFRGLLVAFDSMDPDELEAETSEGVVKLTFADGSKCVLNRQSAARQVWLAEGASAWHFVFDDATRAWSDTKGRGEVRQVLAAILSRRLRRPIALG